MFWALKIFICEYVIHDSSNIDPISILEFWSIFLHSPRSLFIAFPASPMNILKFAPTCKNSLIVR